MPKQLTTIRQDVEQMINDIDTGKTDDLMTVIADAQKIVQDLIVLENVKR